ncbi:glycosyltransferase [Pseudomonadales bacterium]|nr:glycosyltransferase [Pseudomonadales bacterium]
MFEGKGKKILWWGRLGNYGPDYPRNRTVIDCLESIGFEVVAFVPTLSALADLQARFKNFADIRAVWVPCFRQRDLAGAARWCRRNRVPLIFDPLISAFDKRVNERQKYSAESWRGRRLLAWEQKLFALADHVIADTQCHKSYFSECLAFPLEQISVIPVSAEEGLFFPQELPINPLPEALFFGTFIGLQGAEFIAEAIRYYSGPAFQLTFLGQGPDRAKCEDICREYKNDQVSVVFEDWLPFQELPKRICRADICLGVFGTGAKAGRVIPNKVYQGLACGKTVLTMSGEAYPVQVQEKNVGITWVEPGSPEAIAAALSNLFAPANLAQTRSQILPHQTYTQYFSNESIRLTLSTLLNGAA